MYRIARATALPADAIDASQTSENAGGNTPTPTPTEPTGLTVDQYEAHVIAGTLPDSYNLVDIASELAGASYAAVTGASSITVKDSVSNLTSKANEANVATAAGMANNVVVEDSLGNLLSATLPTGGIGGKPTTLLVNEVGSTNITLTDVTLAKAAGAQAELDAFLARTDVAYARNVTKPDALTLTSYSIKDTAANIIAAADDTTLRLVLADADTTTVGDTMKGISSVALSFVDMVDAIAVEDTLSNFVAAKPTKILLETLKGAGATFTATDAPDANGAVTVDIAGLMGFNDVSTSANNAQIGFANAGVTTLNLTSSTVLGTTGTSGTAFDLNAGNFFDTTGRTVNFTASAQNDNISIVSTFGTFNAGAGDDKIELGAHVDIINLGEGTNELTLKAAATNLGNFTVNGGSGVDTIDLSASVLTVSNNVTINGKGGADVITLSNANETVVLGDGVDLKMSTTGGVTAADTSVSAIVNSFEASTTSAIKDKIAFTGDLAKFLDATTGGDVAETINKTAVTTLTAGKINILATSGTYVEADSVSEMTALFDKKDTTTNGKIKNLDANQEVILVTSSASSNINNGLNIWYVNGGAKGDDATDDIIVLLGTVVGDSSAPTLATECFTTI